MTDIEVYKEMSVQIARAKKMNLELHAGSGDIRIGFKDQKIYVAPSLEALRSFLDGIDFADRIAE